LRSETKRNTNWQVKITQPKKTAGMVTKKRAQQETFVYIKGLQCNGYPLVNTSESVVRVYIKPIDKNAATYRNSAFSPGSDMKYDSTVSFIKLRAT
jgi:cold shock CspA family protein